MNIRRNGANYGTGKAAHNRCVFCGRGGARTIVVRGKAHMKCAKLYGALPTKPK